MTYRGAALCTLTIAYIAMSWKARCECTWIADDALVECIAIL
jgi:hypothetical protein